MQATDTSGHTEDNLALVTVAGNYKPGRVTATVTDLVVPEKGWPSMFSGRTTVSTRARAAISATAGLWVPT